jgi:hypothetical protein
MNKRRFRKILNTLIGILLSLHGIGQNLHLTKTLNYHRHISDIAFSNQAPYSPLIYVYKLYPKAQEAAEIAMVSDIADSAESQPPPKTEKPKPKVEYAVKIPGVKDSFDLAAGDFSLLLTSWKMITAGDGDSIYKLYAINPSGIKCTDSITVPRPVEESNTFNFTSPSGRFYLTQKIKKGNGLLINVYDSALQKMGTLEEPDHEYYADFSGNDTLVIVNWTKQTTSFNLQKYILHKGMQPVKLGETSVELSDLTDSWGIRPYYANDTLIIVSVQMYNKRETDIYAMNVTGKIYWKENIPDYITDLNILKGSGKIVVSFYNLQQVSTIKFYSLFTGKLEKNISLMAAFPDFTTRTKWPVYLPLRETILAGGKFAACLINAYSPDDQNISNYYLLVSDGTTIMKAKLRKNKSITSNNIIALSENKFAVVIDDDIYYYSIY